VVVFTQRGDATVNGRLRPRGCCGQRDRLGIRLTADPALRTRMGVAANRRFHEQFTKAAVERVGGGLYRSLRAAGAA
jgi:hypothetical protein